MVQKSKDALTGATREAVMISAPPTPSGSACAAARRCSFAATHGELRGVARVGPIAPGNAQVHWPEGNVLIAGEVRSPEARVPDYNARVSVERIGSETPIGR